MKSNMVLISTSKYNREEIQVGALETVFKII